MDAWLLENAQNYIIGITEKHFIILLVDAS